MVEQELVFIIIPVHNRKSITLSCLETLQQQGDMDRYHIIIFNDGSTDGTGQAIAKRYPTITILNGDGNCWWTESIVQGMNYAYQHQAELIIWLNDDCNPYPGSLKLLVDFCRNHPKAIAGTACYLVGSDHPHASGAQGRQRKAAQPGDIIPVDEMSGHCVCFPAAVMAQIGVPDAVRFPHYHGDSMYILRATRSGFKAYILGDARIDHAGVIKSKLHHFIDAAGGDRGSIQTFKRVFWSKKSFYYLPTQLFYYTEKYGVWIGFPTFLIKTVWWLCQWVWCEIGKPSQCQHSVGE